MTSLRVRLKWQPWELEYGVVVQTPPLSDDARVRRERSFSAFGNHRALRPSRPFWTFVCKDSSGNIVHVTRDFRFNENLGFVYDAPWGVDVASVFVVLTVIKVVGGAISYSRRVAFERRKPKRIAVVLSGKTLAELRTYVLSSSRMERV